MNDSVLRRVEGRGWWAEPEPVLDIHTQGEWGSTDSTARTDQFTTRRPCHVFVMHTSSWPCYGPTECRDACQWLQTRKRELRAGSDLRYNFLIGGDGRVYESRGFAIQPLLPVDYRNYQKKALLFGIIGKYYSKEEYPEKMISLAHDVVKLGIRNNFVEREYTFRYIIQDTYFMSSRSMELNEERDYRSFGDN